MNGPAPFPPTCPATQRLPTACLPYGSATASPNSHCHFLTILQHYLPIFWANCGQLSFLLNICHLDILQKVLAEMQ